MQTIQLFFFFSAAFLTFAFVAAADLPTASQQQQPPNVTGPLDSECPKVTCPPSPEAIYETRLKERARRRHDEEMKRLLKVMQREGPFFSPEKFRKYRIQQAAGLSLLIVGGAGAVTAAFLLAAAFVRGFDTAEDVASNHDPQNTHALNTAGLTLLAATVVTLSAGASLFTLGRKGIKRQRILRRKEEIQQSISSGVDFRLQVDPNRNFLALNIAARF